MNALIELWAALVDRLEGVGQWLAPLGLRLLLAWACFEGAPAAAPWSHPLLAIALLLGLATRLAALLLLALVLANSTALHWPADALLLAYLLMLLVLVLHGGGKLSVDALAAWRLGNADPQPWADFHAWGIVLCALGLSLALLLPAQGIALAGCGVLLLAFGRWLRT